MNNEIQKCDACWLHFPRDFPCHFLYMPPVGRLLGGLDIKSIRAAVETSHIPLRNMGVKRAVSNPCEKIFKPKIAQYLDFTTLSQT